MWTSAVCEALGYGLANQFKLYCWETESHSPVSEDCAILTIKMKSCPFAIIIR